MANIATTTSPIFNTSPRIERVALSGGAFCLVIDDALVEPERVAGFALAQAREFRNVDFNAYPGTYLMPLPELVEALRVFFIQHLRRFFDARRVVSAHCRYSLVTLEPNALRPYQWFCHRDNQRVVPGESIQASVLYLFRDAALGGTGFYEPAIPPDALTAFYVDANTLSVEAFAGKYGLEPGYICDSTRYFTKIGSVPAKWNRLIFYDGSLLHSGDIRAPERLSTDPARGRLTFNGFFVSRRNAA
ncbi:MAG TPA: DUF6445 family protein [Rudaea sp.]|jgi:hypothetical protein|uniref:DUF6445 family protein n=1 Tax=Rudaea sp. TaxID=2136325 RepID=UPI002F940878